MPRSRTHPVTCRLSARMVPVLPPLILSLFLPLLVMAAPGTTTAEDLPDEVRWALEDLYGPDHDRWPLPLLRRDLNGDGIPELVAPTRDCTPLADCEVELFLCKQASGTTCAEYCYAGSGIFSVLRETAHRLRCEATCEGPRLPRPVAGVPQNPAITVR